MALTNIFSKIRVFCFKSQRMNNRYEKKPLLYLTNGIGYPRIISSHVFFFQTHHPKHPRLCLPSSTRLSDSKYT